MSRTYSLAHLTVLGAHPVELVEIAGAAGYDAVGIRIQPSLPSGTIVPVVGEAATCLAIRQRLKDTGVRLLDIEAFWINEGSDLAVFRAGYQVGAELGARFALIAGNDPDRGRLVERFAETCADARTAGLTPVLEFVTYSQIRTLAEAFEVIRTAGATGVGILVDALHLKRSGGSPADLAGYSSELFPYMHLCDAADAAPPPEGLRPEAFNGRFYPGEGELPVEEFIKAFPRSAAVAIEAPSARYAALSLVEQARLALSSAKRIVEIVDRRSSR